MSHDRRTGGLWVLHAQDQSRVCSPDEFTVNGIEADEHDFGYLYDEDPEAAPDVGCCGDMRFHRYEDEADIRKCLEKYGITREQYDTVAEALERDLSFGNCCWCN